MSATQLATFKKTYADLLPIIGETEATFTALLEAGVITGDILDPSDSKTAAVEACETIEELEKVIGDL